MLRVSSEFEADLSAPRRRLWVAVLVCVVLGGAGVVWLALRNGSAERHRDASHRPAPPPAGAFASGGVPDSTNPVIRNALAEVLPSWIIALDRLSTASRARDPDAYDAAEAEMNAARAQLGGPELRAALGARAVELLEQVLTRAHAAAAAASDPEIERATDHLLDAVGSFNDALAAGGHGFFIDGDVIMGDNNRRIVLIYSFTVAHVRLYRSDGRTIRALQLRRLDHLNWSHRLLGFTSPHLREALVLLDQVDELLVSYVLPALAPDATVELLDRDSVDPEASWQREVSARAGEVIRAEYATAGGVEAEASARLGRLLDARRRLLDAWTDALDRRGISLRTPRTLRIRDLEQLTRSLDGVVSDAQLAELAAIEADLDDPAHDAVFAAALDVLVATVERHEVQHRIDAALPSPRPIPAELEGYVGPAKDRHGKPRKLVELARDELSAYSSAMARDARTTGVHLTLISRFLFDRDRWGSAESYAALVIFDGLARELGVEVDGPLVEHGAVARERIARIYLAATAAPPEQVRAAARRLWERLFAAPLSPMEIVHNERDEAMGDGAGDRAGGMQ